MSPTEHATKEKTKVKEEHQTFSPDESNQQQPFKQSRTEKKNQHLLQTFGPSAAH